MQSACSAYVFRLFRQETARGIIEYLREGSSAWSEDKFGIIIRHNYNVLARQGEKPESFPINDL